MPQSIVSSNGVGKPVVDSRGDVAGVVEGIRDGSVFVEPDPDSSDRTRDRLGWRAGEGPHKLPRAMIETVTGDGVRRGRDR